jgi:hypothetical protein
MLFRIILISLKCIDKYINILKAIFKKLQF